jgi:hypothetical protein
MAGTSEMSVDFYQNTWHNNHTTLKPGTKACLLDMSVNEGYLQKQFPVTLINRPMFCTVIIQGISNSTM